jgi:ketosteroid isomerase-like protein
MERTVKISQGRHAIEDIMFRYAEGIDTGHLENVAPLFAHGVVVMPDGSELNGSDEVLQAFSDVIIFYDDDENVVPCQSGACSPRTKHVLTNSIYQFDNAVRNADVRSYFTVYQSLGGANEIIVGGRYIDHYELLIQGWVLIRREVHLENMGDLSRHLNG